MEALMDAVDNLPDPQKEVFISQAIEGRSFKELADETGESINTLLARKRYAVRALRKRIEEFRTLLMELQLH